MDRALGRSYQICETDFEVVLGLCAAGAPLFPERPPIQRQRGYDAPRGEPVGRRESASGSKLALVAMCPQ